MNLLDQLRNNLETHIIIHNFKKLDYSAKKNILSLEENQKASKFIFDLDRIRFVNTRYLIRKILARYLSIDHNEVEFKYNIYGKPQIKNNFPSNIEFNISHSQDIIVCVFSCNPIGVDLENIHYDIDTNMLQDSNIFTINELHLLQNSSFKEKIIMFYKLWTCKEAHLKRLGIGISNSLSEFEVSEDLSNIFYIKENIINNNMKSILIPLTSLPQNYIGTIAVSHYSEVKIISLEENI